MDNLGDLSQCVICSNTVDVANARRLRGRSMAVSLSLEAAAIACLLLWPLLRTAVLPGQYMSPPVPVFHPIVPTNPPAAHQPEHAMPRQQRALLTTPAVHQPPRIPRRIDARAGGDQPPIDLNLTVGQETAGIAGLGSEVTSVAAPKSRTAAPVLMSRGVMAARLVYRIQPEYPKTATLIHLTGTVQLEAIIGTDGSVENLRVVSGNPILAKAAVDAVRRWRYQPTLLSGKPVEVKTVITVQFQMQ